MIRSSPSSISLSESDVDFHLRQTEIYHGLLRQGFEKDDIARYLVDYRQANAETSGPASLGLVVSAPSTVELACRRPYEPAGHKDDEAQGFRQSHRRSSASGSIESTLSSKARPGTSSREYDRKGEQEIGTSDDTHDQDPDQDPDSPVSLVPAVKVNKHAPRKSSLLRFAKAASPERLSVGAEDSSTIAGSLLPNRPEDRRHRRFAFPDRSSTSSQDSIVAEINRFSLIDTSRAGDITSELSENASVVLPPAFSTPRAYSFQSITFASPSSDPSLYSTPDSHFDLSPVSTTVSLRQSSSILGQERPAVYLPSSPPLPSIFPVDDLASSPDLPTTPTPIRNANEFSRTEPRQRARFLDGGSFSVYNDSIPAGVQPQTPDDLAGRQFITERNAAYTAPPGMIRTGSVSISNLDGTRGHESWGEQSPTVRAISLRERRQRELRRSVRAESVRLQRLQLRDEALLTQRAIAAHHASAEGREEESSRAELLQQMVEDAWRDELDADRVGEENFVTDVDTSQRRMMRVVSGNARFEAWEGET